MFISISPDPGQDAPEFQRQTGGDPPADDRRRDAMDSFNALKDDLLQINDTLSSLFPQVQSIPGMAEHAFESWVQTCNGIRKQISEDVIRVAVVGAIKSGKSTFINSLLQGDFLKRGAGVITSIVTRIRKGRMTKARLYFKSWDEVNSEIEQALVLFPSLNWRSEDGQFDIRRQKDRTDLAQALGQLGTEHLINNDSRDANSVLLSSYLSGFEAVKDLVGPEPTQWDFVGEQLSEHRKFAGDEVLAVYLADIELEIDSLQLDDNIEIADCQGSDSSNPIHLSMIQDYLVLTHLIVYVISSRTGLRQADIKFLSIIKNMGIIDNILFVVNSDFNEHETVDDLNRLVEKVRAELSLIKPAPEIFTLSALFNLFSSQKDRLSERDRSRLEQWEHEKVLVDKVTAEYSRFTHIFEDKLTEERFSLLLKNNLERIGVISSGVTDWINLNRNILTRDETGAGEIVKKITEHQKQMNQIRTMIKSTLAGSMEKLKTELKTDIDRFFDARSGHLVGEVVEFIRRYAISLNSYEENLLAAGFSSTLYLVFQEFRQALNAHMAEVVNPEVVRFIRSEEKKITEFLESVSGPFDAMVRDALVDYGSSMDRFGISFDRKERKGIALSDMEAIRGRADLALPPARAQMRYTARIRTEAVMRLGFYTIVKVFKKVLKKPFQNEREEQLRALKDGIQRIKRETERSVLFHFKDYRENIKFQYMLKLSDAAANDLYEILVERFEAYVTSLETIVDLLRKERADQQGAIDILTRLERTAGQIQEKTERLRAKIEAPA